MIGLLSYMNIKRTTSSNYQIIFYYFDISITGFRMFFQSNDILHLRITCLGRYLILGFLIKFAIVVCRAQLHDHELHSCTMEKSVIKSIFTTQKINKCDKNENNAVSTRPMP